MRHVFIDDVRRLVRVVGSDFTDEERNPLALRHNETVPLRRLFEEIAQSINYSAFILPGDDAFLNTLVNGLNVATLDELALLVGQNGGALDVDDANKLIRVRKL